MKALSIPLNIGGDLSPKEHDAIWAEARARGFMPGEYCARIIRVELALDDASRHVPLISREVQA